LSTAQKHNRQFSKHNWLKPNDEDEEEEIINEGDLELTDQLVTLSEGGTTFLEVAFSTKLKNDSRKSKATKNGIPDSRWTRCPKMDAVVVANISSGMKKQTGQPVTYNNSGLMLWYFSY